MFWKFSRVEQRLTEVPVTPFFKSDYLQEQNQSYNLEIFLRFSNIYELSKKFLIERLAIIRKNYIVFSDLILLLKLYWTLRTEI